VGLLMDSTVFIHAERARQTPSELIAALLERFGDEKLALSVMSAGELFHGCCRADTPRRRARREDFVEAVIAAVPSIPITRPAMRIYGRLDADFAAGGERLPTSDLSDCEYGRPAGWYDPAIRIGMIEGRAWRSILRPRQEDRMKSRETCACSFVRNLTAVLALVACAAVAQTSCTGEWTPEVSPGNGVTTYPPVYGAYIDTLQLFDDGSGPALFAGGSFDLAGALVCHGAARWNGSKWTSADYAQDFRDFLVHDFGSGSKLYAGTSSGVVRWTGSGWVSIGTATGGGVNALEIFNDGTGAVLVAGGSFTAINGVAANRVAAWNGTTWNPLGAGTNARVQVLKAWNDGTGPALYAGGLFTSAGAVGASLIAKWSSGTWSSLGAGFTGPGNSEVMAFEVFDDGTGPHLYAGGEFTQSGGQPRNGIAKWSGGSWLPLGSGLTGNVNAYAFVGAYALRVFDPDGPGGVPAKLVAGGPFQLAGGIPSRLCATWDGAAWSAMSATGFESGTYVRDLQSVPVPGGAVLLCGGDFVSVAGISAGQVAQWNGSAWSAIGGGFCPLPPVIYAPPTGVNALAVYDDGAGPAVFAGGYLSIGGAPVGSYVAKWDGTTVTPFGLAFDGPIETLAVLDDGSGPKLFAGGSFSAMGGATVGPLVYWTVSGWTPLGALPSASVHALTVFDDGTGPAIYAGGVAGLWRWSGAAWVGIPGSPLNVRALAVFDTDGAGPLPPRLFAGSEVVSSTPSSGVAQWNGVSWSALGVGVQPTGSIVESLIVADDGTGPSLFVGGWFDYAGGMWAGGVARWSGTSWFTMGPGLGGNGGEVDALVACDGPGGPAIYATGEFGSWPNAHVARWNGSSWQSLGTGLEISGSGQAIMGFDDGTGPAVIVGGRFLRAGTQGSHWLARWGCPRPIVTGAQSGGAGTSLSLTNTNLITGHEYFNVFSAEACGLGPGSGPYLGLCASDPSFLLWQFALPLGVTPVHFMASSSTMQFGPFSAPPMTVDVVCFDWTGGSLGLHSIVTRLVIQ
jgi:trimeric autotransporter adhesin